MLRRLKGISFLFLLLLPVSIFATQTVTIGFVSDGEWRDSDYIHNTFIDEIRTVLSGEYTLEFPDSKYLVAQFDRTSITSAVHQLMNDPEVDVVVAIGITSSHIICLESDLNKPVIAPFVTDYDILQIPYHEGKSGKHNLNYIASPAYFKMQIEAYHEIAPFSHLSYMIHESSNQNLEQYNARAKKVFLDKNITLDFSLGGTDPASYLENIPDGTDAVILSSSLPLDQSEYIELIEGINEKKIASYSIFGKWDVELGVLASLSSEDLVVRRARRTALNIQRILEGENAGDLPVNITDNLRLFLNMATARKIGVSPPWHILTEAEVIDSERKDAERKISMNDAVSEALVVNLDILTKKHEVLAGEQDIRTAWSSLLPQLQLDANYVKIDKDRAESSMGQSAENTLSGSGTLQQVIFSEKVLANLGIQKSLHQQRLEAWRQVKLDITLETVEAYLNVLRGLTLEKVQKDNLKVTRSNLDLARIRQDIGTAGPAEVYRWEAQIASDRQNVISANSQRNLAEIQLNRLLHRPLEENFVLIDIDLSQPHKIMNNLQLTRYMGSQKLFGLLRSYLVEVGLQNSPEISQLNRAIEAQQRALKSSKRSLYTPTIALQAQVKNTFDRSGAGTDSGDPIPLYLPNGTWTSFQIGSEPKDSNWDIAVNASIPLFRGTSRYADIRKAESTLEQLKLQRDSVSDKIEQQIRSSLHIAGASFAAIELSNGAKIAADKSLDLVKDAYASGALSIIDLIDAQNSALLAGLAYVNTIYDFIIDYMQVQRSIGKFYHFDQDHFDPDHEAEMFINDINAYFEKNGGFDR